MEVFLIILGALSPVIGIIAGAFAQSYQVTDEAKPESVEEKPAANTTGAPNLADANYAFEYKTLDIPQFGQHKELWFEKSRLKPTSDDPEEPLLEWRNRFWESIPH
jgi:hypothetical protein